MNLLASRVAFLALTIALTRCDRSLPAAENVAEALPSGAVAGPLVPYPPGRWRLADHAQLGNVILWTSHLLIRHRDAEDKGPCFRLGETHLEPALADRNRESALALAQKLRAQLVERPERFAKLAALHSDDVRTRSLGGTLGGIQALQLTPWPGVLDALSHSPVGTVSEVIETPYGFHVFQRRRPPLEATVSGVRLVVGHHEARWLAENARRTGPSRTRAEAWALADELYTRARANPEQFAALVDQHSDHADAVRSGDMGTWSLSEVNPQPREIEILSKLAIGEVAPPIDSAFGYEILKRMPNPTREWFAVEQLVLDFDPGPFAPEFSRKDTVLSQMLSFSQQIQRKPALFAELQRKHCCTGSSQWQDGRASAPMTDLVSRAPLGEIMREPVLVGSSYLLLKRVQPVIPPAPTFAYELPEPELPSVEAFVASHDGDAIASVLGATTQEAVEKLQLAAAAAAKLLEVQGDLGRFGGLEGANERQEAYRATLAKLSAALGPEDYARYEALLKTHWERRMLASR